MSRTWLVSAVLVLFLIIDVAPSLIAAEKRAVVDIDGNELQSGVGYYVVSVIRGGGGGGLFPAIMNDTSSYYVMQHGIDVHRGKPVIFSPSLKTTPPITIYESTNLIVKFKNTIGVWMLDGANEFGTRYVKGGLIPLLSFPLPKKIWFQIEKVGQPSYHTYKFVHCHGDYGSSETSCGDLGITFGEHGGRWLSLSERPFVFQFIPPSRSGLIRQMI